MKNKDYVIEKLDSAVNLTNNLYNDVENNKQHITKEHLMYVLSLISNNLQQISNRLDLED